MPQPPTISPLLWRAFGRYAEWYVPRHFHAVRLLRAGQPAADDPARPLIVYLNHPSWWDPMICLLLARRFWPARRHYAPIDAAALNRYRFFAKLGFFGVEQDAPRGGATFLRTAREVLRLPGTTLWITAQGAFTDPRQRPIRLRPGLGRLMPRSPDAVVLPLAIEYPFWGEKYAEALAAFGPPVADAADLERSLESNADALSTAAIARDPSAFDALCGGRAGVSLPYDLWRRARAIFTGRKYQPEHGAAAR